MKIKSEKTDKYLDLARVLKKLSNTRVTGILILVDSLETVSKSLERILERGSCEKLASVNYVVIENINRIISECSKLA